MARQHVRLIASVLAGTVFAGLAGCEPSPQPGTSLGPPAPSEAHRIKSDREAILDAVLEDILTSPGFKQDRDFYGTAGDKRAVLVSGAGYGVPWPASYEPSVPGYSFVRGEEGKPEPVEDQPRRLGIRIDKFDLDQKRSGLFDTPIEVSILSVAGASDAFVAGGCSIYYMPKRHGEGWRVEVDAISCQ
jgi:hypothetical protein